MGESWADRGVLAGGLPFNRIGDGHPVVVLQGLTFENRALSGLEVRFTMAPYRRLARARTVYVVNRRSGMAQGTSLRTTSRRDWARSRHRRSSPVPSSIVSRALPWLRRPRQVCSSVVPS